MGEKICAWMWAKMPGLIEWAGGLSEGQLIAAAVMGMLLMYAVITAVYNAGLIFNVVFGGRIISAPTRWDEPEPYEEWMAEGYVHGHYY